MSEIDLDAVKAAAEDIIANPSGVGEQVLLVAKAFLALAAEEAQHAEPISEAWLRELGFVQTAEPPGDFWFKGTLTISPAPSWNPGIGWAVIVSPLHFNRIHRRSQLMDWCRVLGIEVKGGSRADRS